MSKRILPCAAVVLSFVLSGCSPSPAAPTNYASYSQTDLVVGTGAAAVAGGTVTVDYTGWLYDANATDHKGPQFDSSIGRSPFTFTLGAGQVIRGWEQGLVGMKVGGVRRLVIPPSLAYGADRSGSIPPYATLVFDIQLISVTTP